MSTEEFSEEIIKNLINKKRVKMRFSKNKNIKKHTENPRSNSILITSIIKNRDMKLAKDNIRHFFHINWDNKIFYQESIKIGEYMNDNIYWFLINCSYFIEEDIQDFIDILKEEYLNTLSVGSILGLNSYNINDINKLNNQKSICLDKYDYNYSNTNIDDLEKKIKNHLYLINRINRNNINKLEQKARKIKEQLDKNNNIANENIYNCFEENAMYTKNKLSSSIRSKFITYLFNKEKKNLLKKIKNKINGGENDDEEKEDKKYMNICSICNNCYMYQYEIIFQCIQCGLKVHSSCYGIKPTTNPKKWKCEICKEISNEKSINLECILCPNKLGGLKKIHIPINSEIYKNLISHRKRILEINYNNKSIKERFKNNDSEWVHLTCAQWNKSIKFSISNSKKNISIIELNNFEKMNYKCDICNKDYYGPTVKCANNNCTFFCHPECARINDYYMEVEKDSIDMNLKYNLYCLDHYPNKYVKLRDYITNNKIEDVFLFDEALIRVFEIYEKHYNHKFYQNNNSQKTSDNLNIINIDDTSEKKINKNKEKKKREKKYLNNVNNISIFNIYSNENNYINNKIFGMEKIHEENNINLINKRNITNNIIINYNNNINPTSENEKFIKLPEQYNDIYSDSSSQKSNYKTTYINNYNTYSKSNNIIEYNDFKNIIKNPIENNYSNNNIIENNNNNSFNENNSLVDNLNTPIDPLEKEIEQNKESFIVHLIGFFYDYYKKNRIILMKGNGDYSFPESDEEEDNSIYDMSYEDLFSKDTPINEIHYKDLTINLTKKYLSHIFPDKKAFKKLFLEQIDTVMKKLKKNEKFKNKEIFCISQYECKGNKNGKFKLLSIPQFKYQILIEKQIPSTFLCEACLENED